MVEPLNTKAWQAALDALGTVKANHLEPDLRIAVSSYISALPSLPVVDGGELVERLAYRVGNPSAWPEGFDQKASDLFRSAASLISSQKQQISALMNERTSLIETKREQLAQAQVDTTRAQWRAVNAESRVQSLEQEVKAAALHVEQLSGLLKIIREHWVDYDHIFSISVHEADTWLSGRQALSEGEQT